QRRVDSSRRVRQDEMPNSQPSHDPRRKYDGRQVATLVEVHASRERCDALAGNIPDHQPPGMADHIRGGPVRKLRVGHSNRIKQGVREVAEARTENDTCLWKRRRPPAYIGTGLVTPL